MINWAFYPKFERASDLAQRVVGAFKAAETEIDSASHDLDSNSVLAKVSPFLKKEGFLVETGKTREGKVNVPVLFGLNGKPEKTFDADAYHVAEGFVVEVEAGRGVVNNQFLKDLFRACAMSDVWYLAIAVRNVYRSSNDFDRVRRFFDALYASNRFKLPLKGILILGY
ncbi:MAG: hypothetical protein ACE15C_19395 [Phycisphaerae bacterium]